jgi:hypothetical protein
MIVNDPVVLAEAEDAFAAYETALMAYGLDALFWPSEPTVRIALGQNLYTWRRSRPFARANAPRSKVPAHVKLCSPNKSTV